LFFETFKLLMESKMKAEHRHDLKTNELAAWMGTMPDWAKRHLRTVIYVSIVVIVVAGYYIYYRYQATTVAQREQANLTALLSQVPQAKAQIARAQAGGDDRSFEFVQIANTFETIANGSKQDNVNALALIKEAEMIRSEVHFRFGNIPEQEFISQVAKAKDKYTKALTFLRRTPEPSLEAMARFGLGLCEEELGSMESAKKIYQEVSTDVAYQGTTCAAAAKQRLEIMNDFAQKLALKSVPRPAAPAISPAAPGAEMPAAPSLAPPMEVTPGPNATKP
jgi:hypothetical protein